MRCRTLALTTAATLALTAPPLRAQQSGGFDHLHEQARVGNLVCMTEHSHYGEGGPFRSRRVAERQAIKKWSEFTAFEYGAAWGSYGRSAGRRMECKTSVDGGTTYYVCGAHGRPCRPAS
jgi:hypothetical protein